MTRKKNTISQHENDVLKIDYKPTFHGGEIKIHFSNNQIEVLNSMFNFLNQQTKTHLKHNKNFEKISRAKAAKQRDNLKNWEITYNLFSLYSHKIKLKHGVKAQMYFLTAVSKYKDSETIKSYQALGKKLYNKKKIEARNNRIYTMVNSGAQKKIVAQYFGIKPPTLSNILKKMHIKNQIKLFNHS